jgi:hypothetical protein
MPSVPPGCRRAEGKLTVAWASRSKRADCWRAPSTNWASVSVTPSPRSAEAETIGQVPASRVSASAASLTASSRSRLFRWRTMVGFFPGSLASAARSRWTMAFASTRPSGCASTTTTTPSISASALASSSLSILADSVRMCATTSQPSTGRAMSAGSARRVVDGFGWASSPSAERAAPKLVCNDARLVALPLRAAPTYAKVVSRSRSRRLRYAIGMLPICNRRSIEEGRSRTAKCPSGSAADFRIPKIGHAFRNSDTAAPSVSLERLDLQ